MGYNNQLRQFFLKKNNYVYWLLLLICGLGSLVFHVFIRELWILWETFNIIFNNRRSFVIHVHIKKHMTWAIHVICVRNTPFYLFILLCYYNTQKKRKSSSSSTSWNYANGGDICLFNFLFFPYTLDMCCRTT